MKPARLLLLLCLLAPACHHPTPAATKSAVDSPYDSLFGQRYQTKVDLYLFQSTVEPGFTYLGVNRGPQSPLNALPPTVAPTHVGGEFGTLRILAVVPAGATFSIDGATHEVLLVSGQTVALIGAVDYAGQHVPIVMFEFIQVHAQSPAHQPDPDIDPRVASKARQ